MEAIISTVSTIFKERYGAQLTVERKQTQQNRKKPIGQWNSPFVYSRTLRQVSFPIFNSKKELQAIAVAHPVENQDAIIFDEMAQFLQLTISEHIELSDQFEGVVQKEDAVRSAHIGNSNVVQLKTRKQSNVTHFEYKKPKLNKEADLQPIWISGDNENFNAHIAFSIHDWVTNWAFINAKEIPDLIWEDPHHWQSFPQVTIFIPNITSLSHEKLETLRQNIDQLKKVDGRKPLIIITSPNELSDELVELKKSFKSYKANENVTARVQAHFSALPS